MAIGINENFTTDPAVNKQQAAIISDNSGKTSSISNNFCAI